MSGIDQGAVVAVAGDAAHRLGKPSRESIRLIAGLGVAGDAHAGVTVQHRSRVAKDPSAPNLRQVHLVHADCSMNWQRGVSRSRRAKSARISRCAAWRCSICRQIRCCGSARRAKCESRGCAIRAVSWRVCTGLMAAVLDRAADGSLVRKAGVMGVVITGGEVRPGDAVQVVLPPGPCRALEPV